MFRTHTLTFVFILLVGLCLRIYAINLPLLDSKPHREIHTAEETRNLYFDNELLYPKAKLWADEPGYYLVEFPIYNSIVASLYSLTHTVDETWGRLVSVISSLVTAFILYKWCIKIFGRSIALWALAFFYLVSPQEIILSRSFQPDQLGFMFGMLCVYFLTIWFERKNLWAFMIGLGSLSILLLIKISFFPFLFPIIPIAWLNRHSRLVLIMSISLCFIACIPALVWFYHVKNVYTAYPQLHSNFLLQSTSWLSLTNLLSSKWYISILFDFTEQITTLPVFLLAVIGFFLKNKKKFQIIYAWLIGLLVYGVVFSHNLHYWYYQVPFLFPLSIIAATTIVSANTSVQRLFKQHSLLVIFFVGLIMTLTSRPYVLRTYTIPVQHRFVLEAARQVKSLTPPNGKIIASSANNAALTYYSLRSDNWGATLVINDPDCLGECTIQKLEKLRIWGASIYVVSDKNELRRNSLFDKYVSTKFKNVSKSNDYEVFVLD